MGLTSEENTYTRNQQYMYAQLNEQLDCTTGKARSRPEDVIS